MFITFSFGYSSGSISLVITGLTKLGFKEIRKAYVGGREVLMVAPTGSGKSLTFHIAPFVLDFYKHGERDLVDTVCLVISLFTNERSSVDPSRERGQKPLSWAQKLLRQKTKKLQGENTTSCS